MQITHMATKENMGVDDFSWHLFKPKKVGQNYIVRKKTEKFTVSWSEVQ